MTFFMIGYQEDKGLLSKVKIGIAHAHGLWKKMPRMQGEIYSSPAEQIMALSTSRGSIFYLFNLPPGFLLHSSLFHTH